jgi:hypothetical protein
MCDVDVCLPFATLGPPIPRTCTTRPLPKAFPFQSLCASLYTNIHCITCSDTV